MWFCTRPVQTGGPGFDMVFTLPDQAFLAHALLPFLPLLGQVGTLHALNLSLDHPPLAPLPRLPTTCNSTRACRRWCCSLPMNDLLTERYTVDPIERILAAALPCCHGGGTAYTTADFARRAIPLSYPPRPRRTPPSRWGWCYRGVVITYGRRTVRYSIEQYRCAVPPL